MFHNKRVERSEDYIYGSETPADQEEENEGGESGIMGA